MEFTEENSEFELDFGEIMEGGEVTGVSSVNGYTGDVVLSAQDVGAATPAQVAQTKADSQTYTDEKVAAVKEAVEAEIPTDTADLTNGAGFQNGVEVASAITSGISDHNSSATAHPAIRTQISTINSKIPAEASVSNQLSDKTFVSGLVSDEASARELADTNLQGQIDAITSASDVVDVVGTYSELQAYDTQHLKDNDIVKVLVDETHDNAITYYRWTHSTTPYSWIYIGSQGPFYTKAESDTLLNEKADKSNTYTKTEVDTALAGKVDKVAGKGLSTNDFTTEEKTKLAGLENTVLESTTGQSTTAGMTQKAITDALASAGGGVKVLTTADYNWPTNDPTSVALWTLEPGVYIKDSKEVNLTPSDGHSSVYVKEYGTFLITNAEDIPGTLSITCFADTNSTFSSNPIRMFIVKKTDGDEYSYSNTFNYYIDNLTSTETNKGLSANQGKVLKDLINSLIIKGAGAPTTSTVGTVGKLYEDTTNGDLYQCTAVSGSTYTWEQVGGGSSVNVVQSTGTSTTDVMSQKATTDMVYLNGAKDKIVIGQNATNTNGWTGNIAIGSGAQAWNGYAGTIAIGESAVAGKTSSTSGSVAIGRNAGANASWAVAIGGQSKATTQGEFSVGSGTGTDLYNNTGYRKITNVYDGENAHDAVTKQQLDAALAQIQALEARIAALEGNA